MQCPHSSTSVLIVPTPVVHIVQWNQLSIIPVAGPKWWHHPLSLLRLRNLSINSLYPYNRKSPKSIAICKVLADQRIPRLPAQDSSSLDDPLSSFTGLSLWSASELEPASSFHASCSNLSSTDSSTNFDKEAPGQKAQVPMTETSMR